MTIMYISIALIAHNPQFNSQLQKIDSSDEVPSSRGGILTSDKVWLSYWNESLSWDSVNISPGRIVNQHCYQQPPLHRFSNTALLSNMETKRRGKVRNMETIIIWFIYWEHQNSTKAISLSSWEEAFFARVLLNGLLICIIHTLLVGRDVPCS